MIRRMKEKTKNGFSHLYLSIPATLPPLSSFPHGLALTLSSSPSTVLFYASLLLPPCINGILLSPSHFFDSSSHRTVWLPPFSSSPPTVLIYPVLLLPAFINGIIISPSIPFSSLDLSLGSFGAQGVGGPSLDLDLDLLPGSSSIPALPFQTRVISEMDKSLMMDISANAMDELIMLLQMEEPLWMKSKTDGRDVLNLESYDRIFPRANHVKNPNIRIETSRDSGVVIMNGFWSTCLLIRLNKWVELFPTIISKARTIEVLSPEMRGSWNERWLATLQRICLSDGDWHSYSGPWRRRSKMKLAQRMINSFCSSISTSSGHRWITLAGMSEVGVRITVHNNTDPGQPHGVVLRAATSIWLPLSSQNVFNFFRYERTRAQWDVLSNGISVQEVAHIANGSHPGNCISVLLAFNANQNNMLVLQESCTDSSGSLMVYAPVELPAINIAMSSEDHPSFIPLLPSGFAISPDGQPDQGAGTGGASTSSNTHGSNDLCHGINLELLPYHTFHFQDCSGTCIDEHSPILHEEVPNYTHLVKLLL
ncbi:hypothetical protein HHK36_006998 [Tetracentron sinense]|uniref:START domain-containing protein n=1 Tax=Tetracentron sinense TaxID=13715 RepID=A0A834ZJ05_TETSI|nr:hypothetical protein HHK36_006998 [Tetracentron sinense]